ncbi:Uncharacterized conserved protein [Megamonas hypermegale]|uniref:Uncharacterized conserved protein n=1 Tax=Megamonas hypermegale TaxID=158847 RepID=A0A239TT16_9FIRM|nr:phosphatidylglycerol lysyltransferase domain-containing protein [Megamonas hypermegale]SNU99743.1 Uncharacterized conserved protein [Megamonas hypermegale]
MIIILFQELKIEDKNILDPYFQLNYHENSHLNFTNLFMWRKPYHIEWCIEEDILFFIAEYNEEKFALQPLCTEDKFFMAIDKIRAYFAEQNLPLVFSGLEEMAVEKLKEYPAGEFEFEDNRDDYDYVYNSADLIKLAGRKFHSKKNHLNSFRKNYPEAKYLPINDDIITLCKITINGWYKKRLTLTPDDPFIKVERDAIIEVLNNFDQLKLKGGAIFLVNKVMAFTFGEALNTDTAVIHVEKADPDVNGAYTAINQAFVENEWADMAYINREEDMGLEGLRKAKESYRPVKMIKKFTAKFKG